MLRRGAVPEARLLVRLAIDFENTCEAWWDAGGRELWEGVAESPDASSVVVDATDITNAVRLMHGLKQPVALLFTGEFTI